MQVLYMHILNSVIMQGRGEGIILGGGGGGGGGWKTICQKLTWELAQMNLKKMNPLQYCWMRGGGRRDKFWG